MTRTHFLVRTVPLLAGLTAAAGLVAVAAPVIPAHAAPPTLPSDPVAVVDAGDPATQVELGNTVPVEGLVVTANTTIHSAATTTIATGTPYTLDETADASYDVTMTMNAPNPDGSFSAAAVVDGFTASSTTSDPDGALDPTPMTLLDHGIADLTPAIGAPFVQIYSTGGISSGPGAAEGSTATPEQAAAWSMLLSEDARFSLNVPDVPVGAGAVWTYTAPFLDDMTTTYELTSLDGDQYTITASAQVVLSQSDQSFEVDGRPVESSTITTSATFSGSVGQQFARTSTVELATELLLADGAGTVSVTTEATRTSTSVEPAP